MDYSNVKFYCNLTAFTREDVEVAVFLIGLRPWLSIRSESVDLSALTFLLAAKAF